MTDQKKSSPRYPHSFALNAEEERGYQSLIAAGIQGVEILRMGIAAGIAINLVAKPALTCQLQK